MRTLSKPPKTKKIQKPVQKQPLKKPQSKKITKTVFQSPYSYKIETLSYEDMDLLKTDFLPYLKQLREKMPFKSQNNTHKKFLSFKPSQNTLQTLTHPDLILGVKSCIKALRSSDKKPQLVIVFYEENRHELLEEFFCRLLKQNMKVVVARNDKAIEEQFAVKTLTCLGLRNSQIAHKLSKLAIKTSIQIPWLLDKKWLSLKGQ